MAENEILKDIFFIERGYLNANHFVYRSNAPILIDSGYVADVDETEKLITDLGVNLSDVSLIINTHSHCDHIGGNRIIQQRSDCDIALHAVGRHFIDSQDDWSTWWKYYNQEADFFTVTRSLADGESVAVGPHEFEVIYTPGHAADGIVLYNRREKILISSDTLWENDSAVLTLAPQPTSLPAAIISCAQQLWPGRDLSQLSTALVVPQDLFREPDADIQIAGILLASPEFQLR